MVPLRTHSSPSCTALVRMPMTSLPACGSERQNAGALGAVGDGGDVALVLLAGAGDHDRSGGQAGEQQHQGRGVGVLDDLLDGDGEPHDPGAATAEVLRDAQAQQAGVSEHLEDVLGVLARLVDLAGPGLDLVLRDLAAGLLQGLQLVGELEVHGAEARGVGPGGGSARERLAELDLALSGVGFVGHPLPGRGEPEADVERPDALVALDASRVGGCGPGRRWPSRSPSPPARRPRRSGGSRGRPRATSA